MSGHRVVAILDANKEAFIFGSHVRRRKASAVAASQALRDREKSSGGTDITSSSSSSSTKQPFVTELVVGNQSTFKLRTKEAKKEPTTTPTSTTSNNKKDASKEEECGADIMMAAASRGEDVSKALERQHAAQQLAAAQKLSVPKPMVLWRQEHCFIRAVTPLLSIEGEKELEEQRRLEEEAEKAGLYSILGGKGTVASAAEEGDALRRDPNDPAIREGHTHGFVVHYFSTQKPAKKTTEESETGKGFVATIRHALMAPQGNSSGVTATTMEKCSNSNPPLRFRVYICTSQYEQQEWCLVYKTTLLNYWHERLETSIIRAPEVFQFQAFAMDLCNYFPTSTVATRFTTEALREASFPNPPVVHVVLSTAAIYLIPRPNAQAFLSDAPVGASNSGNAPNSAITERIAIEQLKLLEVHKDRGLLLLTNGATSSTRAIALYTPEECTELVIEIQRIWEMGTAAATDAEATFPYKLL